MTTEKKLDLIAEIADRGQDPYTSIKEIKEVLMSVKPKIDEKCCYRGCDNCDTWNGTKND